MGKKGALTTNMKEREREKTQFFFWRVEKKGDEVEEHACNKYRTAWENIWKKNEKINKIIKREKKRNKTSVWLGSRSGLRETEHTIDLTCDISKLISYIDKEQGTPNYKQP